MKAPQRAFSSPHPVDILSRNRWHFGTVCKCAAQLSVIIVQLVTDAHRQLHLPRQEIVCNLKHAACCFHSSSTLKQVGADLMDFVLVHLFLALEFALARRIDQSEMRRMLSGSPPVGETPFKAPGSPSMFLHFHVTRKAPCLACFCILPAKGQRQFVKLFFCFVQ